MRFLAVAFVLLLAIPAAAEAPPSSRPPNREQSVIAWALSHRPLDPAVPGEIAELARSGAADAETKLLAIGEPARRALFAMTATDAQLAVRMKPLLAAMQSLEDEVERRALDHDVATLATLGPAAAARVQRILPKDAPMPELLRWAAERAGSLRWEPVLDRFVLAEPWGTDQAPLRFRRRETLRIEKSAGLVSFNSAVTLEMWVRAAQEQQLYLAADEAWPELDPVNVPVSQESGFALRRNARGGGTSTLEMTCGMAPRGWWTVESAPLRISTGWEHVAVVSDSKVIRLFRNGELVAARAIGDARFVAGIDDLCVGLRVYARADRGTGIDVRGFRISEGARYVADFIPPQRLTNDTSALCALDFTPGQPKLRDVTEQGRNGFRYPDNTVWVPPLDTASVRAQLNAFGGNGGELLVAEAESGGRSSEWFLSEREFESSGVNAEIWTHEAPGTEGHWLSIPFRVPRAGEWRIHLVGAALQRLDAGEVAPFSWQVDGGAWHPEVSTLPTLMGLNGNADANLSPLAATSLAAGEHVFRMRLLKPRDRPDDAWSIWVDAIVLEAAAPAK